MHGGTLIGLAFGIFVGVLLSFGVVWYLNKTPLPFVDKVLKPDAKPPENGQKAPLALPGKPGDKPIEKPGERKFEFYDILEGKKVATPAALPPTPPDTTTTAPPLPVPAPTAPAADTTGHLYLQVGAFQKTGDAEKMKARLAMLGFEASVLEVEVADKGTMHRVRVGPYASADEMNQVRGRLSQNDVPATVVRVKD